MAVIMLAEISGRLILKSIFLLKYIDMTTSTLLYAVHEILKEFSNEHPSFD